MKRLAPLALVVLALALVPAALADDGTNPAPASTPAASNVSHAIGARARLELLRLRVELVRLRFRVNCGPNGKASQDACTAAAQKIESRLTTIDGNVQTKLTALKACTSDSTDASCKNADKKIALLTKIDTRLQKAIQSIQSWLSGQSSTSTPSSPSSGSSSSDPSDSGLDTAASDLSQAAGSNG